MLEAQASVLSVAPIFDDDLAANILAESNGWLSDSASSTADPIGALRLAGLLVEWSGVMRIADPLRSELASRLAAEHPSAFRSCAEAFTAHARNGFHSSLARVLGEQGAAVSVAVLDLAASEPNDEQPRIDALLRTLQAPSSRPVDTAAALRQLNQSPVRRATIDRLAAFLSGLYFWRLGRHREASEQFETVLARRQHDQIEAIARHLTGVYRAEQRDFDTALLHLEAASDLLRRLGDNRGLVQTLTTYGRVLALSATSTIDFLEHPEVGTEQLVRSAELLDEAVSLGEKLGDDMLHGRAIVELSRVEYASERIESAVELAEDAARVLARHQSELANVYTLLGTLYREAGLVDEARQALYNAAEIAERFGDSDPTLARILNVQASADRRAGRTKEAIRNARESVAIGRRLADQRHTAHALHTLGASLLDADLTSKEAIQVLREARSFLDKLKDFKGVKMVDKTLSRVLPAVGI